jgi:hypothetical protein
MSGSPRAAFGVTPRGATPAAWRSQFRGVLGWHPWLLANAQFTHDMTSMTMLRVNRASTVDTPMPAVVLACSTW